MPNFSNLSVEECPVYNIAGRIRMTWRPWRSWYRLILCLTHKKPVRILYGSVSRLRISVNLVVFRLVVLLSLRIGLLVFFITRITLTVCQCAAE